MKHIIQNKETQHKRSDPTDVPIKDEKTAYFLVLSGGAFRGAVQYYVVYHLMKILKIVFEVISGTSTGSITGGCAGQDKLDVLLGFYKEIRNKRGYLRLRYFYLACLPLVLIYRFIASSIEKWVKVPPIIGGLYSMGPIKKKLKKHIKTADFVTPFVAHVISANTGARYQIDSRKASDERMVLGILSSSCMAPIMKPPFLQLDEGGGKEMGWDGGYRDIFPPPPEADIEAARAAGKKIVIHAVGCTPRERIHRITKREIQSEIDMLARAIELFESEIYDTDIIQLQKIAGEGGEVHLWLPHSDPGNPMDATQKTIQRRLNMGEETVEAGPIILPGLAA